MLAVQQLSLMLRTPVDGAVVDVLRKPSTATNVATIVSAASLLQRWEENCIARLQQQLSASSTSPSTSHQTSTTISSSINHMSRQQSVDLLRKDCTARIGELVTMAMQLEQSPLLHSQQSATNLNAERNPAVSVQITRSSPPSLTMAESSHCFSLPPSAGDASCSASSLLRASMARGPGSVAMLAKLLALGRNAK